MIRDFTSVTKMYDETNTHHTGYIAEENNIILYIPLDQTNRDYQAIQQWIADGGTVIDNGD